MKRHETLLKLVQTKGLGFAQTNEWGNSKPHLLQMRKEGLVDYITGQSMRIVILNHEYPYGPGLNGYWYTITFKGLDLLGELYPEDEEVKEVRRAFVRNIMTNNTKWIKEYDYRK